MPKQKPGSGIVYSTNPEFRYEEEEPTVQPALPPSRQPLKVKLDTKQRAGKAVTVVMGFAGPEEEMEELGKKLKTFCGTGGSVKEGIIIVQGDNRVKIIQWLHKNGFTAAKQA